MDRRFYDLIYRFGAPWEGGPREEMVQLVRDGTLTPGALGGGRAIDLGCGSGANAIFLAGHGFEVTGVDFSPVALRKARRAASSLSRPPTFAQADLTAEDSGSLGGPFDLLVDYGTLDDLKGGRRVAMVRTICRISRPGSVFLLWSFYGERSALPRFSFTGPSRPVAGLAHGEEEELFGDAFTIEELSKPEPQTHGYACFLMRRR